MADAYPHGGSTPRFLSQKPWPPSDDMLMALIETGRCSGDILCVRYLFEDAPALRGWSKTRIS